MGCFLFFLRVPEELAGEVAPVINKGNIYAAKTSPPAVHKAYLEQFQKDFKIFLRSRSEELVPGGAMVLTFPGRLADPELMTFWEITGMALHDMVLENLIEGEKLDSFNIPVYCPTAKEVEQVIEAEGSFTLTRMECFNMDWYAGMYKCDNEDSAKHFNEQKKCKFAADHVRAVLEPVLKPHFGAAIMDDLFLRFATKLVHLVDVKNLKFANLTMSMTKNIG
ncbi:Methyltransferase-like protein [Quillaja saponaria]|uniref:Methyltransferase-like protein n=1 Tax=Quillaja saponaria TaxID=32244 RepID=A0AAD7PRS4_QUISA|nr:Methyltransferase-like protein [Quillaja saponaria]